MNAKLIAIHAPPAPKCFETRDIWVEYLASADQAVVGKQPKRNDSRASAWPFVDGKYNPHFAFCSDCPAKHAHAMFVAKRCDFKAYVASLTPAAPTEAEGACSSST